MANTECQCPFCDVDGQRVISANEHAVAVWDAFPVSQGHALIFPRRHVEDVFTLSNEEILSVVVLVRDVKLEIANEYSPCGFNVGINIGHAAGQTVNHAHIHIIPRYAGDVDDPTGGIRNVIPGKGRY